MSNTLEQALAVLRRQVPSLLAGFVLWLALAGNLWAAPRKGNEPVKAVEQGYVLPYLVTVVAVTLGVAAVCFPSQRKNEVDFDEDDE